MFFYSCISCKRERRKNNKKEHMINMILSAAVVEKKVFLKLLDWTMLQFSI